MLVAMVVVLVLVVVALAAVLVVVVVGVLPSHDSNHRTLCASSCGGGSRG